MSETQQQKRNGGLDPRRWHHQLKAERDDLPLLDARIVTDTTPKTTTPKPQLRPNRGSADT